MIRPVVMSFDATVAIEDGLALSTSADELFRIIDELRPQNSLICCGYAGCDASQLEDELADNVCLTYSYLGYFLFDISSELRLNAATKHPGVNLSLLSTQVGPC